MSKPRRGGLHLRLVSGMHLRNVELEAIGDGFGNIPTPNTPPNMRDVAYAKNSPISFAICSPRSSRSVNRATIDLVKCTLPPGTRVHVTIRGGMHAFQSKREREVFCAITTATTRDSTPAAQSSALL
jgi:hypothetical protein